MFYSVHTSVHTCPRLGTRRTRRPQSFEVRGRKIEKFFHGVLQQAPIVPMVRSDRHFIFTVLGPKKDLGHFRENPGVRMSEMRGGVAEHKANKQQQQRKASVQAVHPEVPRPFREMSSATERSGSDLSVAPDISRNGPESVEPWHFRVRSLDGGFALCLLCFVLLGARALQRVKELDSAASFVRGSWPDNRKVLPRSLPTSSDCSNGEVRSTFYFHGFGTNKRI